MQHNVNCRLAQAVVVPDAIPPERWTATAPAASWRRYPGLKEEYYLADFEPDRRCSPSSGWTPPSRSPSCAPRRRCRCITASRTTSSARCWSGCAGAQTVVLPRTPEQRAELARAGGFVVPERAIDAQSLIAYADLVVSAGGTMNREAVALGTPVFTVFEGRLGAVDERLIAEGRLARLERPDQVQLVKREPRRSRRRTRAPRSGAAASSSSDVRADARLNTAANGGGESACATCARGWYRAWLLVSDTTLETPHALGPEGTNSSPPSRSGRAAASLLQRYAWWLVGAGRGRWSPAIVLRWANTRPGYDPYGWLDWGYHTLHGSLEPRRRAVVEAVHLRLHRRLRALRPLGAVAVDAHRGLDLARRARCSAGASPTG